MHQVRVQATSLQAVDDTVLVEYGTFLLSDFPEESRVTNLVADDERIIQGGLGLVYCRSGGTDHYPAVRIEVYAGPPPAPTGWQYVEQDEATFRVPRVRLYSVTSELGEHVIELPEAGRWHVRALSSGRQEATNLGGATFAVGVERWCLQLWPVETSDRTS